MIDLRAKKLPVAVKGQKATEKKIGVAENGQIRFNSLASDAIAKWFTNPEEALVYFIVDDERNFIIDASPFTPAEFKGLDAAYTVEDAKKLSQNKEAASGGQRLYYTSIAAYLTAIGYDYKNSGAQSFSLVSPEPTKNAKGQLVAKKRLIWRNVPEGALEKRAFTPRNRKEKPAVIETAKEPELVEA